MIYGILWSGYLINYVYMEFYIISPSEVGAVLRNLCTEQRLTK